MEKRLYVGGLPFDLSEDELHSLFCLQGKVTSTKLIRDKYSGQSRGFAFVEMDSEEDAKNTIEKLNGHSIGTQRLIVNEARPQKEQGHGSLSRGSGRRTNFRGRRG